MVRSLIAMGIRRVFPGITLRYRRLIDSINAILSNSVHQQSQIDSLSSQLNDIRQKLLVVSQSIHHSERLIMKRKAPWRCVFLVHSVEIWSSLHAVWLEMSKDPRFDPIVVTIPRKYPGSEKLCNEENTHNSMKSKGIPHIRIISGDLFDDLSTLRALEPQIIFRQSHWDADISPAFAAEWLGFAKIYYIDYSIAPIHVSGFRASPLYRRASGIFIANDAIREFMPSTLPVITSGHPRVDYLCHAEPIWPINTGNKFKIIWSAHHSTGTEWTNFGTFWMVKSFMLNLAQVHPEIDFLFSPHPALVSQMQSISNTSSSEFDVFCARWCALPNTGVLTNGDYAGPFKASDLLIVDGISFLLEYQLNQKPVLFLEREDHSPFNAFGVHVKKGVHPIPAEQPEMLVPWLDHFSSGGKDPLQNEQKALCETYFNQQRVPEAILESIANDMAASSK